jgi:hypothetical protein
LQTTVAVLAAVSTAGIDQAVALVRPGHKSSRGVGLTGKGSAGQEHSYVILRIPKNLHGCENPQIMKKILVDTLKSSNANLRNSTNYARSPRGFVLIPLILVCFALCQQVQSATDTPDPGAKPLSNTADGANALLSITTGLYNSAFGFDALLSNTDASFNTGIGAGALLLNTASENTAVGAGALLSNTDGTTNTAVGAFSLFFNVSGGGDTAIGDRALQNDNGVGSNTATGFQALFANTIGFNNAAYGIRAMESNVDGQNNTAIGNLALNSSVSTSDNVCVGRHAGDGITTANNNVIVGHLSGVHSVFGEVSDRCFIENIFGAPVSAGTAAFVLVDSDGRLGTFTVAGADPGGFSPKGVRPQAVPDAKQAKLNLKVDTLQATVVQQQKQIQSLTAQLKEQAAQIQKVSAQLEVKKPAARVVSYGQ